MYYIFGGEYYYPSGGGDDLVGFSPDLFTAVTMAQARLQNNYTVWVSVFGADDEKGLVLEWESRKLGNKKIFEEYKQKES